MKEIINGHVENPVLGRTYIRMGISEVTEEQKKQKQERLNRLRAALGQDGPNYQPPFSTMVNSVAGFAFRLNVIGHIFPNVPHLQVAMPTEPKTIVIRHQINLAAYHLI
jgi:hypothetical protein